MSVRIVGAIYDPGRSMRLPPMITFAPWGEIAPSTCFKVNQGLFRGHDKAAPNASNVY
jgi:hypothetical protein